MTKDSSPDKNGGKTKPGKSVPGESSKYNFFKRQQELQARERMHELFKQRVSLANAGVRAFKERRPAEAVRHYQTYLRVIEDFKGVSEGGLTPAHFDPKRDMPEIFLISAVYWDLMKLYDRTKSAEKKREFLHYTEKFIQFSKGMPFQVLCAETLRKYTLVEKPVHRDEFQQAYKMIAPISRCFIATSLVDVSHPDTLPRLRKFRDETLDRSRAGRAFTRIYYQAAPAVARVLDRCPAWVRKPVARALDRLAALVQADSESS